jgi:hypothetical protein
MVAAFHDRLRRAFCIAGVALTSMTSGQTLSPPNAWTALDRDGKVIVDPANDIPLKPERDLVGCDPNPSIAGLTCANPADSHPTAQISSDADFLYLRLRVDGNPGTGTTLQSGYGCQINTNGIANNADHCYEKMVVVRKTVSIDLYTNPAVSCSNSPADAADTLVQSVPINDGNVRVTAVDSDFFVDFAVSMASAVITPGTPLNFVCGTNSNGGNVLSSTVGADIANNDDTTTSPTWSSIRSDSYMCGAAGCAICPSAAIVSNDSATFETDTDSAFQVLANGCPRPDVGVTGTLPDGIVFDSANAALGGSTGVAFIGDYPLTFTASDGMPGDPVAEQPFVLHVVLRDLVFRDGFDLP